MTNIEKSRNNLHADVDLNELVKEMREANEAYMRDWEKRAEDGQKGFEKMSVETAMAPAVHALCAFNTILFRIGMTDGTLPFLLAGFDVLSDNLMEHLEPSGKMMRIATKQVLAKHVTAITVKVPRKE